MLNWWTGSVFWARLGPLRSNILSTSSVMKHLWRQRRQTLCLSFSTSRSSNKSPAVTSSSEYESCAGPIRIRDLDWSTRPRFSSCRTPSGVKLNQLLQEGLHHVIRAVACSSSPWPGPDQDRTRTNRRAPGPDLETESCWWSDWDEEAMERRMCGVRHMCTLTLLLVSVCPLCCRASWMWVWVRVTESNRAPFPHRIKQSDEV